jgi:hypothetical protein
VETYSEPDEVRRARSWLIGQRLPHHDPDTLALVAARLEARRRGRWFDFGLFMVFAVLYMIGLFWVDAGRGPLGVISVAAPVVVAMSISLVRRAFLWSRRERDTAARLHGRVTTLERPTWEELLGWSTLVCLAGLVASAAICAAVVTVSSEGPGRPGRFALLLLSTSYGAALLALARRRSTVARDDVSLVADRRLRAEEAAQAIGAAGPLIALVPILSSRSSTATAVVLCAYLLVTVAAWWHGRRLVRGQVLQPASGGAG